MNQSPRARHYSSGLILLFAVVTAAEIWAFQVFREHPIHRPAYFSGLLTAIQFVMCYGGIESARWLLRRSAAAHCEGPDSDWTRLWLWLGPPGGLLMVISSLVAWRAAQGSPSWVPPAIFLAHAAGGGILWLLASLETLPQLARLRASARGLSGSLAAAGLFTHLCGIYAYAKFYPAGQLQVGLFLLAIMLVYFVFYYIWATCLIWGLAFRFWRPAPALQDQDEDDLDRE